MDIYESPELFDSYMESKSVPTITEYFPKQKSSRFPSISQYKEWFKHNIHHFEKFDKVNSYETIREAKKSAELASAYDTCEDIITYSRSYCPSFDYLAHKTSLDILKINKHNAYDVNDIDRAYEFKMKKTLEQNNCANDVPLFNSITDARNTVVNNINLPHRLKYTYVHHPNHTLTEEWIDYKENNHNVPPTL